MNTLQAQSSGKLDWQGCHEIAQKSSKIVPLGAHVSHRTRFASPHTQNFAVVLLPGLPKPV
jgi:hypothetical protein